VSLRFSILQGSANGTAVYIETVSAATNENGLVTAEIGSGTSSDDFGSINWADGPFYLETEIDPNGGSMYSISATNQLMSVPYAMHANSAESYSETDPVYSWL
jgi:hypothetical protein